MLAAKIAIIITLALSTQFPPSHRVAVVLADRTEIVALKDAQAEFRRLDRLNVRTEEQAKRHAALHLALSTLRQDSFKCGPPLRHGEDSHCVPITLRRVSSTQRRGQ